MSLEAWIGGIGIAVFTMVFVAGMLLFSNFDEDV